MYSLSGFQVTPAAVTGLLAILGFAFPKRLPGPGELDFVQAFTAGDARWDAPALVTRNATLTFGHEALIAAVAVQPPPPGQRGRG